MLKRKLKSYRAYGSGQFLKKEDISEPVVWTITDVQERTVTVPGKAPAVKLVLFFDGNGKVWCSIWPMAMCSSI